MRPHQALVVVLLLAAASMLPRAGGASEHWVGTWSASPSDLGAEAPTFKNQTVREIVHVSLGGPQVRLRLANNFGVQPLAVGAVHLALRRAGSSIEPGSDRMVTFSGQTSLMLPAGSVGLSDPVRLDVPANADLAVSLYFPALTRATTMHVGALQTSYVDARGDATGRETLSRARPIFWWPFLVGVSVTAADIPVAWPLSATRLPRIGSTLDANRRWTDFLAERLRATGRPVGIMNAGIGGNRVLQSGAGPSALARFDRDVLVLPGLTDVVIFEGINDLGNGATGEDVIVGLHQLAERAHEKRLRVFGATVGPYKGSGYYSATGEARRQTVNRWIRSLQAFDGVLDFDLALRDPARPTRLLPSYDCGDHLHPSDAGYAAMANSVDVSLFR